MTKLAEAHAFQTPAPDIDGEIWVVPLFIAEQLEAEVKRLRGATEAMTAEDATLLSIVIGALSGPDVEEKQRLIDALRAYADALQESDDGT